MKKSNGNLPFWMKYFFNSNVMDNLRFRFTELDIINSCNMYPICSFCCCKQVFDNKTVIMTDEIVDKELRYAQIHNLQGGYGIVLTGGGECTIHPKFREIVDKCVHLVEIGDLSGFSMVSNGIITKNVQYFINKTKEPVSWIRVSVNDQSLGSSFNNKGILQLFKDNPGRIGASFIYSNYHEWFGCKKNARKLKKYAKFIRIRIATNYNKKHKTMTPERCEGKLIHRVVEPTGILSHCCQMRGYDGKALKKCPEICRWADFDKNQAWGKNPFS